jgi:hypothetical protein
MTSAPAGQRKAPTQQEIDETMAEYQAMLAQQQQQEMSWPAMLSNIALYAGISFFRHALSNPIQRLTIILNTEAELVRQGILAKPLGGIIPSMKHLFLTEGLMGSMFRGTVSDALMLLPIRLVEDIASSLVSSLLQQFYGESIEGWSQLRLLLVSIAASAGAMTLCVPVSFPREAIIGRMHCDIRPEAIATPTPTYRYSGPIAAFKSFSTYRKLFSGAAVGVMNLIVYRSAFYLSLNGLLGVTGWRSSKLITIGCTFLATVIHHPLEVIRQRLIVSGDGPKPHASPIDCAQHIVKKQGYKGLYQGLRFRFLVTVVNVAFVELVGLLQS